MKIAIVGSGVSGMTCAHFLSKKHDVHLFEADHRIGGHTHTVKVETVSGKYNIDTGFIVFNDRNYPHFTKLMEELKVPHQDSTMSFSVKVEQTGLEYNGTSINSLFCQRKNFLRPSFHRMVRDILRFNREATQYFLDHRSVEDFGLTLEKYLRDHHYSQEFTEHYIMPMGAAIWSASREEMRQFPFHFFVRFFHHHGMLTVNDRPQWKVLKGGSQSYVPHLTKRYAHQLYLNSPVLGARRKEHKIELQVRYMGTFTTHDFDHVIFATHADQTLKILNGPTPEEASVLGSFSYRPNDVVLHTDTSVLPKSKLAHASWNYFLPQIQRERVAVTYHMNILQGLVAPEKFLVSLNMDHLIDEHKIIQRIPYSHPVYNEGAVRAQRRWSSISGKDRIHFCGAYWGNGFHEDGVLSALKVCRTFGEKV